MNPWEEYAAQGGQVPPWEEYRNQGGVGFDAAVEKMLGREGGYVNDPDDRGGETKYGISKSANPDVDIPALTVDKAKQIYKERYWDAIGADKLPAHVREMAFDAAVNQGVPWTKGVLRRIGNDPSKLFDLRARRYATIVKNDPTQAKFQRGWEKRLEEFAPRLPWEEYKEQGTQ